METQRNVSEMYQGPFIGARTWFYLILPKETYFETVEEMPPLIPRAIPPGTIFLLIEVLILMVTGRSKEFRLHSAVVSWTSTAMYEGFSRFIWCGAELTCYQWVFENFRVVTFPWNAFSTYLFAMITVDCCSYWWHRMSHETAIMWASHELHHSSDDYNLSVAFRNSAPMRFFRWTFYIPLALAGIPTSIMVTHLTLGAVYNGITHQQTIPKLPRILPGLGHFLEFLFVTPSHHRVHHASNKYCIDKNYGQFLIIWDRMFGTFAEEKDDEPLTYGTLTQPQTYDMAKLQVSSFVKLWQKFRSMETFGDKMRALFYGPGWFPGTPRLGNCDDIPDVRGRAKYSPEYPLWMSVYLVANAFSVVYSFLDMAGRPHDVSETVKFINLVYLFYGFSAIGGLYDRKSYAPWLELARILLILGLNQYIPMFSANKVTTFVTYLHYADIALWPLVYTYVQRHLQENEGQTVAESEEHLAKASGIGSTTYALKRKFQNGRTPNKKLQNGHTPNRKFQNGHTPNGNVFDGKVN